MGKDNDIAVDIPFYKRNVNSSIDTIEVKYLLEATPYKRDKAYNFSGRLTEDTFYKEFYTEMWLPENDKSIRDKNITFDETIKRDIEYMGNPDKTINLLHVWGYAGCGKTTYMRHLLWQLSKKNGLTYHVINFEKCTQISTALETFIIKLIGDNEDNIVTYFNHVANEELFDLTAFPRVVTFMRSFAVYIREYFELGILKSNKISKSLHNVAISIENQLKQQTIEMESVEEEVSAYSIYIDFLLTLIFIISLIKFSVNCNSSEKIVALFDNVDSVQNIKEEYILLEAISNLLNASHVFFESNNENESEINGKKIADILNTVQYGLFLTTRVVTLKRYIQLKPDFEDSLGYDNHEMPEYFYDHVSILKKRSDFYQKAEKNRTDSLVLNSITGVYELSKNVYRSSSFKKLFNGNVRFCFSTLCFMYDRFQGTSFVEDCKRLNEEADNKNSYAGSGANGIVLAMVLAYFKENDQYSKKLHLSSCSQDNRISLSRLILTILHENNNRCSMLDIFQTLPSEYVNAELCDYIWDLSEEERNIWRRLILFEKRIPKDDKDLERQCDLFKKHEMSRNLYTELMLCRSGDIFIENVIPHFEFMMSRCVKKNNFLDYESNYPLYSSHSLQTYTSNGKTKYMFEDKIDKVYSAVAECSLNSQHFAEKVVKELDLTPLEFMKDSKLNYHEDEKDRGEGSNQSYIGRLVFSHVGYIERYRRYLIKSKLMTISINERLTLWIKKYLELYKSCDELLHSERQDGALRDMMPCVEALEISGFRNFNIKIESKNALET